LENGKEGLNELNALTHPGNFLVIPTKFGLKSLVESEKEENEAKKNVEATEGVFCSLCDTVILPSVRMSRQKRIDFLSNVEKCEHPIQHKTVHQKKAG
jgi:hypothetical protein